MCGNPMKIKNVVLLNDTSFELHHGCKEVIHNLKQLLVNFSFKVIAAYPVGCDWRKDKKIKEILDRADLIIVNGEGSIHHQQLTGYTLAAIGPYAKKRNIPAVLLNTTYEANGEEIADLTRTFTKVFVRETRSKVELDKYGIPATVVPDLTFHSNFSTTHPPVTSELIGFTDSPLEDISNTLYKAFAHKNCFVPIIAKPQMDSRRKLSSSIRTLVFNSNHAKITLKNRLLKRNITFAEARCYYAFSGLEAYKAQLAQLNCLINARYHALCFAIQMRIPFLTLPSNVYKIEGLLEDIGIGQQRLINLPQLSHPELLTNIAFTPEELSKIDEYCINAKNHILNMMHSLRSLVD